MDVVLHQQSNSLQASSFEVKHPNDGCRSPLFEFNGMLTTNTAANVRVVSSVDLRGGTMTPLRCLRVSSASW